MSLLNGSRGEFYSRRFYLTDILAPGAADVLTVPLRVILFFSTSQRNHLVSCFCLCNKGLRGLILPRLRVPLASRRLNGEFVVLLDEIYTGQTMNYVFSSLKLPLNHQPIVETILVADSISIIEQQNHRVSVLTTADTK